MKLKKTIHAFVLAAALALPSLAHAQAPPLHNAELTYATSNPSGACSVGRLWWNYSTNHLWVCEFTSWTDATAAAGVTFPLLADSGCTTPSYGFTGDADLGLCSTGVGNTTLQSGATNPRSRIVVNPTLSFWVATDAVLGTVGISLNSATQNFLLTARGHTRVYLLDRDFKIEMGPAAVGDTLNVDSYFNLYDVAGANDFIKFINKATPANIVSMSRDTDAPSLEAKVTDGTNTLSLLLDAGEGVSFHANDGTGNSSSGQKPRGFYLAYNGNVPSASTITPYSNVFHVSGTTNIDSIAVGVDAGTCVVMIFDDVLTVGDLTGNINLSAAFVSTANDTLSLCADGSTWFETGRSVN